MTLRSDTALGLLFSFWALASCGTSVDASSDGGPSGLAEPPRPDVIVVAIDGIGLQDLTALGGSLANTLGIDRLVAEGATYIDTVAPSPWPAESLAAALSGRTYVSQEPSDSQLKAVAGAANDANRGEDDDWTPSLADLLRHEGYRTGLFLAHEAHVPPLSASPLSPGDAGAIEAAAGPSGRGGRGSSGSLGSSHAGSTSVSRDAEAFGFDVARLVDGAGESAGAEASHVAADAIRWLGAGTGPALLVVTLADPRPPHHLYRGVVPAAETPYEGPMTAGLSHSELLRRQAEFTDNDLARLVELHATEVAVADQAFRQIAGAAVQRRKTPPVLVVIGLRSPALGEGGRLGLVPSFDPAALAVPMVVRFPKPIGPTTEIREERARALRGEVAVMASLIDLTPTLIDALGLDPRMDLDGRSLFPGALAPARSLVTCTKRGVRGGTLFQGDSAVSIQFGPEETKFFRRTGVTAPFAPMDAPTADELAIRDDLRGWLSARGF